MFKENNCTYCGEPSDTKDHVTPVSKDSLSRKNISYSKDKVIPCCGECNSTLGNLGVFAIGERANYLYHRYKVKYNRHLNIPRWSKDEIINESYSIRESIYDAQRLKLITSDRLEFLTLVDFMNPTIADVWETIESGITSKSMRKSSLRKQYEMYDAMEGEDMVILEHMETKEPILLTSGNRHDVAMKLGCHHLPLSGALRGTTFKIKEYKVLNSLPSWMLD